LEHHITVLKVAWASKYPHSTSQKKTKQKKQQQSEPCNLCKNTTH